MAPAVAMLYAAQLVCMIAFVHAARSEDRDELPGLDEACRHLKISGYTAPQDGPLHCGTTLELDGAVHFRPSYTATVSAQCALFYHPGWNMWVLGRPTRPGRASGLRGLWPYL